MKRSDEDFHLKYKNSIMMLVVIPHVIRIGWMLLIRCSMIWSENLAIQMRQYNYCDVLHSFIQVKKCVFPFISLFDIMQSLILSYYSDDPEFHTTQVYVRNNIANIGNL